MKFLLLASCASGPLVALDQFVVEPIEAGVPCDHFDLEEGVLEIKTIACNAIRVAAPALRSAGKGARVRAEVSHTALRPPDEAAEAVLTLSTDAGEVARHVIPLPAEVSSFAIEGALPAELAKGAPVRFEVTNHGVNSYRLLSVELR